jgi:hypothetical protein
MIHVLVGAADEFDAVLKAATTRKPAAWRVPKKSHTNDPAIFYLPSYGFVGRCVIAGEPRESELGRYVANVRDIALLASVVPLAFVKKHHPSWKWLNQKMKSYTTIDGTIQARLEVLLNEYQATFAEPLTEVLPRPRPSRCTNGTHSRASSASRIMGRIATRAVFHSAKRMAKPPMGTFTFTT